MSLTSKAVQYLQKTFPNVNFLKDIIIQDDGQGPYIKHWGIGTPLPSEESVNLAAESLTAKEPYPTLEEQLLMLYHDQKNGTKTFSEAIDEAKK